jgi:hypothetical protein
MRSSMIESKARSSDDVATNADCVFVVAIEGISGFASVIFLFYTCQEMNVSIISCASFLNVGDSLCVKNISRLKLVVKRVWVV